MNHVEEELGRIAARLAAYPDPFEHAGLYAAQQALRWALEPSDYASPYSIIIRPGSAAGSRDCSEDSRLQSSSNIGDTDNGRAGEPQLVSAHPEP